MKQIEAVSAKKAIKEAEAKRKRERRAERLREHRAKIREEERAKRLQSGEEQRKRDEKKQKRSGETKEERMQREFKVYLDELNAEQPSSGKKQKVSDDSPWKEEQAQEEHGMEIVVQQMEEIHIEDLDQPEDLNQENQMGDQPEALQVIEPSGLPHYPPFLGPHHYQSFYPVELVTPGTSLDFIKSDQSKGHLLKSGGTIKIPRYRAPMFPPMVISEVLRHTSLSDLKDLHMISRLEQEREQVKANVVLGTSPEGSLSRVIIHHNSQVFLAPDRMLPHIQSPSYDKGKEEAVYHHLPPP